MEGWPTDGRTEGGEVPRIASLVVQGLADEAVRRVAGGGVDPDEVAASVAALRRYGRGRHADLLDLVARSPEAAALVAPPMDHLRWVVLVGTLGGSLLGSAIGVVLGPWTIYLGAFAGVGLALRWARARRRCLTPDEAQLMRWWWRERWRFDEEDRRLLLYGVVLVAVMVLIAAAAGALAASVVFGIVAVALLVLWSRTREAAAHESEVRRAERRSAHARHSVDLPILRQRPRGVVAAVPAALLAATVPSLLLAGGAAWASAAVVGATMLGHRAWTSSLVVDERGIRDRGLVRTRRWSWSDVWEVRTRDDGDGRARVEILTVDGATHTLWSGPSLDPLVVEAPALDRLARGERPPSSGRRALGCLGRIALGALVVLPTLAAIGALTSEPVATVDPAAVPAGTELHVLVDVEGRPISDPRLRCPSPLAAWRDGAVPGVCDDTVGLAQRWFLASAAVATAAWVVVVVVRGARRRRAEDLVQPPRP